MVSWTGIFRLIIFDKSISKLMKDGTCKIKRISANIEKSKAEEWNFSAISHKFSKGDVRLLLYLYRFCTAHCDHSKGFDYFRLHYLPILRENKILLHSRCCNKNEMLRVKYQKTHFSALLFSSLTLGKFNFKRLLPPGGCKEHHIKEY